MLSPRLIDKARVALAAIVCLTIGACAGGMGGGPRPTAPLPPAEAPAGDSVVGKAGSASVVPPAVQTQFEQATAALAAGDRVDAELRFKEFVLLYPDYPGAHVNLAIIHAGNDDLDAARSAVDAALLADPQHPAALNQLGVLQRKNGDFRAAEDAYLKAITVSPDYALAHYNLGVLYELYLQRLDEALTHFEAYRALVGEDDEVDRWIADLRRRTGAGEPAANATE